MVELDLRGSICPGPTADTLTALKELDIMGIGIFRFSREGKVVESWDNFDQLGMMQQLSVIPSPEQAAGWSKGRDSHTGPLLGQDRVGWHRGKETRWANI
jgi:hypothetical protein